MAGKSSELQEAIDRLVKREPGWKRFKALPEVGARPGAKSVGRPSSAAATLDLIIDEDDYDLREHWPDRSLTTSDGVFVIEWLPIKKVSLVGNGSMSFQEPTE